jgi:2-polyprenyl-6-methoxyphenol hydroxylase-like FAD-dependent oxidoreductase
MADIVLVGGGVVGLGTAMLLAADGHEVTVLERDGAQPPDPHDAWERWERKGVNQFRLPHFFLARYRGVLDAELPALAQAIEAAGGLRYNVLLEIPEQLRGPERPEDGDVEVLTGRRPVVEAAASAVADETPHLTVRRGVAVEGLVTAPGQLGGIPHVTGVRTGSGEEIGADLVVDMSGRRSPLPRWLADVGARPMLEEMEDSGFIYYARHYRSPDGSRPFALGPGLMHLGTISTLTLPGDNGTWSVVVTASAGDKALYGLRDVGRWERVVRALPLVAHWLDGEPIDEGVVTLTKIEDRRRSIVVDGEPVATGIVAVADAWACSNPSVGRGTSIGMLHGLALRDTLRETGTDDAHGFSTAFAAATAETVSPWFEWTRDGDRHRLAEIDHGIRGETYAPADSRWELEQALGSASSKDPDLLRMAIRAAMVLDPLDASLTPEVEKTILELGANWRDDPVLAPTRDELVALAND